MPVQPALSSGHKLRAPGRAGVRVWLALAQAALVFAATRFPQPEIGLPMLAGAIAAPLLLQLGLWQFKNRSLIVWVCAAALLSAALALHAATRGGARPGPGETALFWLTLAGLLGLGHCFVVAGAQDRRLIARYPALYDTAWTTISLLGAAAAFTGGVWLALLLGAGLFAMVKLEGPLRLLGQDWLIYPAITVPAALAIHGLTGQTTLLRSARDAVLTRLSWLLPLLAAIVLAFLAVLPVTSLAPLWATHFATALLLAAVAALGLLINSLYQDGTAPPPGKVRRIAASVAALELLPLAGLAAWALGLRVAEYGWTEDRIIAAAAITLAGMLALGYATSVWPGRNLPRGMARTNIAAACVAIALALALLTPLADPARLMVADQLARLASGAVPPDKFDFAALRSSGGRWGAAALQALAAGTAGGVAATKAKQALAATPPNPARPLDPADLNQHVTILPAGQTAPPAFFAALASVSDPNWFAPCLRDNVRPCTARWLTLAEGQQALLFFGAVYPTLFVPDGQGVWQRIGQLPSGGNCTVIRQALETGTVETAPHPLPDLIAAGARLTVEPPLGPCPKPRPP